MDSKEISFHKNEEQDFFRDTWIRYLGYANEVGESFRPLVPVRYVHYSYGVATAYVLADTASKAWKGRKQGIMKVATSAGDALVWQTLASIVIPGFVINRICAGSMMALGRIKVPPKIRGWATVGIGLASIPIVVHPIDRSVTFIMDNTYRRIF